MSQKRILICPLDWGLGHATRCIPIIRLLLKQKADVIIAADGGSSTLLKQEFPALTHVQLKGYDIQYGKGGKWSMIGQMLKTAPKVFLRIIQEHQTLKTIIKQYKIDVVISDNRYGLWNKDVKSIFITHQLMIKTPFGEQLLHRLVHFFVKKYDECWVPDLAGEENISGDLSHKYPLPKNTSFVGLLTRFESPQQEEIKYDILAIVSGPEPQRSIFEKLVLKQLSECNVPALLIAGLPNKNIDRTEGKVRVVSHLSASELQSAIQQSEIIIARSGYSTLMDLSVFSKKLILVPTPGQTEQEYLAEKLAREKKIYYCSQDEFQLNGKVPKIEIFSIFGTFKKNSTLEKKLNSILSS